MQKSNLSQRIILIYVLSIATASILLLSWMFLSPSELGNSVFLGLSLSRSIIAFGFVAAFVFFAALSWRTIKDQRWADWFLAQWFGGGIRSKSLAWLACISLGLGWIGCFLPDYRAGAFGAYWNRIQPVMILILIASIATLFVFLVRRNGFSIPGLSDPHVLRMAVVLFVVTLPVLSLVLYSKYNAYKLEDFWYGAAVPILASQLIFAILAGLLFLMLQKFWAFKRFDLLVFILLYLGTAALWAYEPLQKSFLFKGPNAPNGVLYPFADAATFDVASQFGLIGQGIFIFNTPFFERTLYLSFLIYLHYFFGQNYPLLMAIQAAIFAILAPLVYLIGRSLNMRAVGFAAAVIVTLRGINSIAASNLFDTASPKMVLTDFPTAIGIALIVLFACEWFKKPEEKWRHALWVGGAIGLTLMLRTNALIFLLFIPLYAFLCYFPQWKKWLIASTLMVLAVIAITLPWELRNVARGGMLYGPIVTKIQHVIRTRYPVPSGSLPPQENIASFFTLQQTKTFSSLYSVSSQTQEQACQTIACFAPKHFIHNAITSILLLPTSPVLDDLRHMVKTSNPYWRADWNGHFTFPSLLLFALNSFLIALGISVAWKKQRLVGLTPLAVFVFYNISNAFGRTSGGRYVVPADWIISFYYVIGVLFLITEIASAVRIRLGTIFDPQFELNEGRPRQRSPFVLSGLILVVLFGAGLPVPLAEKLYPPRYANFDFTQALQENKKQIAAAGLTLNQVNEFLKLPGAEMLVGRTLYPRWYKMGGGEFANAFYPYNNRDFPRTAFVLIGPKGADGIVLPGGIPKYLPHTADALVIGCREKDYVDALAVIILDATQTVYTRTPMSELTCPLRQPVCSNNSSCK